MGSVRVRHGLYVMACYAGGGRGGGGREVGILAAGRRALSEGRATRAPRVSGGPARDPFAQQ